MFGRPKCLQFFYFLETPFEMPVLLHRYFHYGGKEGTENLRTVHCTYDLDCMPLILFYLETFHYWKK